MVTDKRIKKNNDETDERNDGNNDKSDHSNSEMQITAHPGNLSNLFKPYSSDSQKHRGATTDSIDREYLLFFHAFDQSGTIKDNRF